MLCFFFSASVSIRINQLHSMLKLDFIFVPMYTTLLCVVLFSFHHRLHRMHRLCPRKKVYSLFFLFLHTTKTHGKKGNENALTTHTSRSHFLCLCICFAKKSTDTKKRRERPKKKKNDSSIAEE